MQPQTPSPSKPYSPQPVFPKSPKAALQPHELFQPEARMPGWQEGENKAAGVSPEKMCVPHYAGNRQESIKDLHVSLCNPAAA